MFKFYFDFTNGSLGSSKTKFHGGGDFSRFIFMEINQYYRESIENDFDLVLVWPKGKIGLTNQEMAIKKYPHIEVDSLMDIPFDSNDILFIPVIDAFTIKVPLILKKKFPDTPVYCVLHGLRLFDMLKYDPLDHFYYTGMKRISTILWVRRYVAGVLSIYYLKHAIPLIDRIYTVSNNTMQRINKFGTPKYIKYFTRNIAKLSNASSEIVQEQKINYALFINANRHEKNFIRSLQAFCKYKVESSSDLHLIAAGISPQLKRNLKKVKGLNWEVINRYVKFMDYVSSEDLQELYKGCKFLLYTSKSEGYGLPPLEAMNYMKPTVASSITSVPEVLGFAAHYVNPYEINSIAKGISFMDNPSNQQYYINLMKKLKPAIYRRGKEDIKSFVRELFLNWE